MAKTPLPLIDELTKDYGEYKKYRKSGGQPLTDKVVINTFSSTPDRIIDDLSKNNEFVLDRKKYPDVEETPYGFIYNVGGKSITDVAAQNRKFGIPGKSGGFTLAVDGDESFYEDWDSAYKAAKGIK